MISLANLKADVVVHDWTDSRRSITAIHHEISKGVFIHIGLGAAGLQVYHGPRAVGIPLDEIVKLIRKHDPMIGAQDAPMTPEKGK